MAIAHPDQSALSQQLLYPVRGEVENILWRLKGKRRKGSGGEGGFFGRKFACNLKNSQIGVGERLRRCQKENHNSTQLIENF
ncbi:hypothetical protein [aff. Roholtiella sp. LEGE 12411]|uniref:hypothetical protein n=1 Tax=aff. Roholtiella sp. LEGE 12411 TaxID=1828822 RepID=UPI0030DAE58A